MHTRGRWGQASQTLWEQLAPYLDKSLPLRSRIHRLRLETPKGTEIWIKRDDELGGWLGGGKWRKYASLLPFLERNGIRKVVLIGGAHSNHLASLVPLLTQYEIEPYVLARGEAHGPDLGNRLWLRTALPAKQLQWVGRSEWSHVEEMAQDWASTLKSETEPIMVLPEGGAHPACAAGSLTLAADVLGDCVSEPFDHIFSDAGTGYMASALLHGLSWAKYPGEVHTVLMAETEDSFHSNCIKYIIDFQEIIAGDFRAPKVHLPILAPRFGQANLAVLSLIQQAAKNWGLWLDPVYGAKLVHTVLEKVKAGELKGRVLVVHGGGMSALGGFTDKLSEGLDK